MTLTAQDRAAFARMLDDYSPLDPVPPQFAALDVAGLRRMYVLTHATPQAAFDSLRAVTDPVRVLAVVAPHAIPRAQAAYDARRERERLASDAARALARDVASGRYSASRDVPDAHRETDDDGRVVRARATPAVSNGQAQPGATVALADGSRGTVLYVVSGATIVRCPDGRVVSL